jgi:hypothetical protein
MTENDTLFMNAVSRMVEHNKENPNGQLSLYTSKGLLSDEVLKLMDTERNNTPGTWFMGVYVNFEPMFRQQPAKDWQRK